MENAAKKQEEAGRKQEESGKKATGNQDENQKESRADRGLKQGKRRNAGRKK